MMQIGPIPVTWIMDHLEQLEGVMKGTHRIMPVEPDDEMIDRAFGSIGRYFATLPQNHAYRKKGWVNGAKAGARVKHRVRYRAMIGVGP